MVDFNEGFEVGSVGSLVTKENTSFWEVEQFYTGDERMIVHTSDAYAGGKSASVTPASMAAAGETEVYQEMIWIGSSPDNLIIDEPVNIEWFYKFESANEPFFGRYIFEAWFDSIGNEIVQEDFGDYYPDTNYLTHLFVGLEHSNEDPGDDPDGMYYYHSNIVGAHGPENDFPLQPEVITPQFPRGVWLKMTFNWAGAGLPYTMKVVTADDESVVHMDITLTAPEGIGLSYWAFNAICTRETGYPGAEGYDFQNWFDGLGGALGPFPRRVFPRDDGLAGGAPRTFPPSKAEQSSNRIGPGSVT